MRKQARWRWQNYYALYFGGGGQCSLLWCGGGPMTLYVCQISLNYTFGEFYCIEITPQKGWLTKPPRPKNSLTFPAVHSGVLSPFLVTVGYCGTMRQVRRAIQRLPCWLEYLCWEPEHHAVRKPLIMEGPLHALVLAVLALDYPTRLGSWHESPQPFPVL